MPEKCVRRADVLMFSCQHDNEPDRFSKICQVFLFYSKPSLTEYLSTSLRITAVVSKEERHILIDREIEISRSCHPYQRI